MLKMKKNQCKDSIIDIYNDNKIKKITFYISDDIYNAKITYYYHNNLTNNKYVKYSEFINKFSTNIFLKEKDNYLYNFWDILEEISDNYKNLDYIDIYTTTLEVVSYR